MTYGELPPDLIELIVTSPKFPEWLEKARKRMDEAGLELARLAEGVKAREDR